MAEQICFFQDYLGELGPLDKRRMLQSRDLSVIEQLESPDTNVGRDYPRLPLGVYAEMVGELRRIFGFGAPSMLAGLVVAGPQSELAGQLSGSTREVVSILHQRAEETRSRLANWSLRPDNWFLVESSNRAFQVQSELSSTFPCIVIDNGPLECAAGPEPDVELMALDDIFQAVGIHQIWASAQIAEMGSGTVAVLDTGVNTALAALAGITAIGVSGLSPFDTDGHGSAVVRLIRSLCPDANILSIRVMQSYSEGQIWNLTAGLTQLFGQGGTIVNMSLGVTPWFVQTLGVQAAGFRETVSNLLTGLAGQSCFGICAAGNDGQAALRWPAASPHALAVGSHNASFQRSSFSNFQPEAENLILAPGGEQRVVDGRIQGFGRYGVGMRREIYGTSFSTAVASAVSCLLLRYGWFNQMQTASRISLFRNHCRQNGQGLPLLNIADLGAVWPL